MRFCLSLVVLASSLVASAETLLELPVSATANTAYLTSMSERPWWNKAWKRRAPLLVSSRSEVSSGKTIVDSIVDFGEKVNPDEVRLVTPWETEVPCVCEPFSETAIRLLFKTRLRIQENKPFLVYWGNPAAKKPVVETVLQMWENGEDLRIANGVLDLTFDKTHRTEGLLKHLRVIASQTPDELYNLAAQSHVQVSFEVPEYSGEVDAIGVLRILEAVRILGLEKTCRIYQASTSELFGKAEEVPQTQPLSMLS